MNTLKTYKMFRVKNGNLYPMFVDANTSMPVGEWLEAKVGDKADETHVKSRLGKLSLRPGFHSTFVPFTDWIGKKAEDGTLLQRSDTVWCECEVRGEEVKVTSRYGLRTLPEGFYFFRTNAKQKDPWIISRELRIARVLTPDEVDAICEANGIKAQKREAA